jgi:hypothetical protein
MIAASDGGQPRIRGTVTEEAAGERRKLHNEEEPGEGLWV